MRVPEGFELRDERSGCLVVRSDLSGVPSDAFRVEGEPLSGAAGRGAVRLARVGGLDVVVRRFRRGGALRQLVPDLFPSPNRAVAELTVLARLRRAGVPVVEPVAAIAKRRGPLWELRLLTVRVDGALPLPAFVAAAPALRRGAVDAAGRAVAAAFAAGLRHPDLHPDNLLGRRDGNGGAEVLLLDFDRATLGAEPTPAAARDAMLVRMARYLRKHAARLPVSERAVDVVRFLRGLGLDGDARRATLTRLRPILHRQLERRRFRPDVT